MEAVSLITEELTVTSKSRLPLTSTVLGIRSKVKVVASMTFMLLISSLVVPPISIDASPLQSGCFRHILCMFSQNSWF